MSISEDVSTTKYLINTDNLEFCTNNDGHVGLVCTSVAVMLSRETADSQQRFNFSSQPTQQQQYNNTTLPTVQHCSSFQLLTSILDPFNLSVHSFTHSLIYHIPYKKARIKRDKIDIVYGATGSEFKTVQQRLLEYDRCGSLSEMRKKDRSNPADPKKQICDTPLMASDEFNPPMQRIQAAGTTAEGKNKNDRNSW